MLSLICIKFKYWMFNLRDLNHPANTGKPIVAVLKSAPAKIMNGIRGYFSIMAS